MSRTKTYEKSVAKAVTFFWDTRNRQSSASTDTSSRGAVVAGKQMDGFVSLLQQVARDAGVPEQCIYTRNNYLPGYFRASKDWDFLIISPKSKLIAAIELKSQIGSYGNNLNNRAEEAIGSAEDFWVAFREGQFPNQREPWLGYLMVVGKDPKSTTPVKNRYCTLVRKLMLERKYSSAALLCTSDRNTYEDDSEDTSIVSFLESFYGHLIGARNEFK